MPRLNGNRLCEPRPGPGSFPALRSLQLSGNLLSSYQAVVERSSAHCVIIRLAPDQYGLVNHRQLSEGREAGDHANF